MIKVLAVVLAALAVLLGLHMMFDAVWAVTVASGCAVAHRGMQYGWRTVPRAAR